MQLKHAECVKFIDSQTIFLDTSSTNNYELNTKMFLTLWQEKRTGNTCQRRNASDDSSKSTARWIQFSITRGMAISSGCQSLPKQTYRIRVHVGVRQRQSGPDTQSGINVPASTYLCANVVGFETGAGKSETCSDLFKAVPIFLPDSIFSAN